MNDGEENGIEEMEFRLQTTMVQKIKERRRHEEQNESEEAEKLLRHLEEVKGKCAICIRDGLEGNGHSIYFCMEDDEAVRNYKELKEFIRKNKGMERFGGCSWCFVPQGWCNRWEENEGGEGWVRKDDEKKCKFMDVILGGFIVFVGNRGFQEELKGRMMEKGLNIKEKDDVVKYIGKRIKWGGLEVWILLKEYWEGVKRRI